jgi:hypothetical protein
MGEMMTGYQSKKNASLDKLDDDDTQVYQRRWVDLTEDELLHIGIATGLERAAIEMISNKLKEKNT